MTAIASISPSVIWPCAVVLSRVHSGRDCFVRTRTVLHYNALLDCPPWHCMQTAERVHRTVSGWCLRRPASCSIPANGFPVHCLPRSRARLLYYFQCRAVPLCSRHITSLMVPRSTDQQLSNPPTSPGKFCVE